MPAHANKNAIWRKNHEGYILRGGSLFENTAVAINHFTCWIYKNCCNNKFHERTNRILS